MATTPRKPTKKATTAAKPAKKKYTKSAATAAKTPAPLAGVTAPEAASKPVETPDPVMKKKDLIDRVVSRSGMKKKDVKPVVEAMLEVLGKSLANGEEMNIQPFGKVMIKRTKEMDNARMVVCRIRQRKASASASVVKLTPKP